MKRAYGPTVLTLCLILYGCAANTGPSTTPTAETPADTDGGRDLIRWIPVTDDLGATTKMEARICRPDDAAPARLVVINHGSPPHADERPTMQLEECSQRAVRWFVDRGFVVVEALRRGYGATGGVWAEGYGSCEDPDYVRAELETARDIGAVVTYATALPFVIPDGVTVVGQSAGGWGTIAYDSSPTLGSPPSLSWLEGGAVIIGAFPTITAGQICWPRPPDSSVGQRQRRCCGFTQRTTASSARRSPIPSFRPSRLRVAWWTSTALAPTDRTATISSLEKGAPRYGGL